MYSFTANSRVAVGPTVTRDRLSRHISWVRVATVWKRRSGGVVEGDGSSAAMLSHACSTDTKEMAAERRRAHEAAEQEGNWSHMPQEEDAV